MAKLWVGLCNPGDRYRGTRHNIGADLLVAWAMTQAAPTWTREKKFDALVTDVSVGDERIWMMLPETYMNRSGRAVLALAQFYKIDPAEMLILTDDVDLPTAKLRLRKKGSAGGHNGLTSVFQTLGTTEIPRLKIGVGRPSHPQADTANWVLGKFTSDETDQLLPALEHAIVGLNLLLQEGFDAAGNHINAYQPAG